MATTNADEAYEHTHVHAVYDQIAPHFSSTRYKPWPTPERFLASLAPGSIGIDAGCGNGKYLSVNTNVFIIGSDRSAPLVGIAADNHVARKSVRDNECGLKEAGTRTGYAEALVADALILPHPEGAFDFAISIAVLHHLSTRERRVAGVREVLRKLKPAKGGREGGRALMFVWALEQERSRRGWKEGDEQDVMVPWVLQQKTRKKKPRREDGNDEELGNRDGPIDQEPAVYERYYHLYRQGELEDDVVAAGGTVLEGGYERDNWWCIASRPR